MENTNLLQDGKKGENEEANDSTAQDEVCSVETGTRGRGAVEAGVAVGADQTISWVLHS